MPWSIWFLPVIVAVSFEQKKEARFDLNLIFVQIHPRRPVKKSQISCAAATFGFLHIFVTFGALSFALWMFAVAHAFLLLHSCWQLWVCVWKRKCFPTFYLCNGYLFPCDVFFHVAARHCSFLMPCFISNPELYLSARWVYLLSAIGTTLQTRDHNVYVTLWQRWGDGRKWYYDIQTRCSSQEVQVVFWIMQSRGKVSFQESPPAASDFLLSSTWRTRRSLLRTPMNRNLWSQCMRIWAMMKQKIKLGDSRVVFIITSACRKGWYVCGLEMGQREASSTSAQFN